MMINLLITLGLYLEVLMRFSKRSPRFRFWFALYSVTGEKNTDGLGVKLDGDY